MEVGGLRGGAVLVVRSLGGERFTRSAVWGGGRFRGWPVKEVSSIGGERFRR